MKVKRVLEKFFGSYSEREIKRLSHILNQVLELDSDMQAKSHSELRAMTDVFREKLSEGCSLEDILPEAFAVCREASWRVLELKHFPVQIIGGIVLHQGRVAEMKTGEGKTLVAVLPAYLNALSGKGVHIVTVNDYLAKRDSEWMGKVYNFLGLSVGLVTHDISQDKRCLAYAADITYSTNNELGFDYLRDNMVIVKDQRVQRGHSYAIVDEVDNILIDEARTPLIISGIGDKSTVLYDKANRFVASLKYSLMKQGDDTLDYDTLHEDSDYVVDEKFKTATLTPLGVKKAEQSFDVKNLADLENMTLSHHINQALKAYGVMKRDRDYVVKENQVIIVDEFTGRMMEGRRYSDGLHQALEAKENVKVESENKTLASITYQNYFRLYNKLSGMTGTALTEEEEFREIYKLDVVSVPTNESLIREDLSDSIYISEDAKFRAIIKEVQERHAKGQPVLIGTISIEKSEKLSAMLRECGIRHQVLNAKFHEKEAEIIAQAGTKGTVTIATNMAGRGTDIVLGGNVEFMAKQELEKLGYAQHLINECNGLGETQDPSIIDVRVKFKELKARFLDETTAEQIEVLEAGGLCIIGTERHESRRIDNQLRGRAGRQGDKGISMFFLSTSDDLMRLFGSERIANVMRMLKIEEDEPIISRAVSRAIEGAQRKVEGRNFDIRKHVIQYDDVNNQQREVIYRQRNMVLDGENIRDNIIAMISSVIEGVVNIYIPDSKISSLCNFNGLREYTENIFFSNDDWSFITSQDEEFTRERLIEKITETAMSEYGEKEAQFGEVIREIERIVLLRVVDEKWMSHIDDMEQLRQGIALRAYAQRDPIVEYKFEGMSMFEEMIGSIKEDTIRLLFHIAPESVVKRRQVAIPFFQGNADNSVDKKSYFSRKLGRNSLCPCGSGEKYKKCCGAGDIYRTTNEQGSEV